MFTGIIESVAEVRSVAKAGESLHVRISVPKGWRLRLGESVSINGICSTVASLRAGAFEVVYIPETLKKTTASGLIPGSRVNCERSLRADGRIDGHFVAGHVDAAALVTRIATGDAHEISFNVPESVRAYVVSLGSIALNGVSLTVARIRGKTATVALVPHTLGETNLGNLRAGEYVNIEADMLARYTVAAARGGGRVVRHATKRIRKGTSGR